MYLTVVAIVVLFAGIAAHLTRDPEIRSVGKLWVLCGAGLLVVAWAVGCAPTTSGKVLNGGVVGAGVADLHSTRVAIDSGKAREANPLLDHGPLAQAAIKSLGIGAVVAGAWWLDQKQQRVLAHVARIAAIAVWSAAALHNYRINRN